MRVLPLSSDSYLAGLLDYRRSRIDRLSFKSARLRCSAAFTGGLDPQVTVRASFAAHLDASMDTLVQEGALQRGPELGAISA